MRTDGSRPDDWAADHAAAALTAAAQSLDLTDLEVVSAPRRHADARRIPGQGVVLKGDGFHLKTVVRRGTVRRGNTWELADRYLVFVLVDDTGRMLPVMQYVAAICNRPELERALKLAERSK